MTQAITTVPLEPFGVCVPSNVESEPLRELVRATGLVVSRGMPADLNLVAWSELIGQPLTWPFGEVLDIRGPERDNPGGEVPLHWDGLYQSHVPEFQVLQCVSMDGPALRTTFCHTTTLLLAQPPATVDRWRRTVVSYPGPVTARSPLVASHPVSGDPTLRYVENADLADAELDRALSDPRFIYTHTWQPGDLVISDNLALLHGRESFSPASRWHLRRVHVLGDPPFVNPAVS